MLIVDAGNSTFAAAISSNLSLDSIKPIYKKFPCGEYSLLIEQDIKGQDLLVVAAWDSLAPDNFMQLLLLLDALDNKGAAIIRLFVPYIPYSRQDRVTEGCDAISAKVIAKMLNSSAIDQLITLDIHSLLAASYFTKELININSFDLFGELIQNIANGVIVAPDQGAISRAQIFANKLSLDLALINKRRNGINNSCTSSLLCGEVEGKHCIIIDDIIDSGNTVKEAALLLRKRGAELVSAYITHGLFSEGTSPNLKALSLNELWITNSIDHQLLQSNIKQLNIIDALCRTLIVYLRLL